MCIRDRAEEVLLLFRPIEHQAGGSDRVALVAQVSAGYFTAAATDALQRLEPQVHRHVSPFHDGGTVAVSRLPSRASMKRQAKSYVRSPGARRPGPAVRGSISLMSRPTSSTFSTARPRDAATDSRISGARPLRSRKRTPFRALPAPTSRSTET